MDPEFLSRIRDRRVFPPMPQVAMEVVRLCDRGEAPSQEVARWIGRDPALAARFVRMANSATLGVRRQIGTVSQAVNILGLRTVRHITLASAVAAGVGDRDLPGFDRQAFWQDSVVSGLVARALLFLAKSPHAEEAFLAGLVRDTGIAGLARALGKTYAEILEEVEGSDLDLGDVEAARLGGTHADVSAMLLEEWGFPVSAVVAVRHHVAPPKPSPSEGASSSLTAVLFATEGLGRLFRAPTDRGIAQLRSRVRDTLGIGDETIRKLLGYVEENLAEMCEALGVEAKNLEAFRANRAVIEQRLDLPIESPP